MRFPLFNSFFFYAEDCKSNYSHISDETSLNVLNEMLFQQHSIDGRDEKVGFIGWTFPHDCRAEKTIIIGLNYSQGVSVSSYQGNIDVPCTIINCFFDYSSLRQGRFFFFFFKNAVKSHTCT